jgi:hypothetical protein
VEGETSGLFRTSGTTSIESISKKTGNWPSAVTYMYFLISFIVCRGYGNRNECRIQVPGLPLSGCVTLGQSLPFSGP